MREIDHNRAAYLMGQSKRERESGKHLPRPTRVERGATVSRWPSSRNKNLVVMCIEYKSGEVDWYELEGRVARREAEHGRTHVS